MIKNGNKINKCRALPILSIITSNYILSYLHIYSIIYCYLPIFYLCIFGYKNNRKPHKSGVYWVF